MSLALLLLPLLLSPRAQEPDGLITGEILLGSLNDDPLEPHTSVAYLPDEDRFLAAWNTPLGAKGSDLPTGRLLTGDGTPLGQVLFLSDEPSYAKDVNVASVRSLGRFVAVYHGAIFAGENPWISSFDASGTLLDELRINAFANVDSIDVGGEATLQGSHVLVVTSGPVRLYRIDVTGLQVVANLPLSTSTSAEIHVAITPTGGASGRYLVTWSRFNVALLSSDIWACVVDREANVLVAPFALAESTADETDPEVDGDGTRWVVAYESGSALDHDIACRQVTYLPSSQSVLVSGERIVESDVGQEERDPAVAWLGESAVIAWAEQFSGNDYDVYMTSLESFACLECEGESLVANPSEADEAPSLASRLGVGGATEEALVVWTRDGQPPTTLARVFHAEDGVLVDLGGGCGGGGTIRATCAASGAANFGLALEGAAALQPGGLLLGLDRLDLVCGLCTLVLDPLVANLTTTDAMGGASFTFAVPDAVSFAGAQFLAQWFVRSPSCGNFSFSSAFEITVE